MNQRPRLPLFFPARFEMLKKVNYQNNLSKLKYHYNHNNRYRPYYGLASREIIAIAQRPQKSRNPIYSFYQRRKWREKQIKPYFDIDKEQLQQIVNRLNIQTRLSKKQLNEQQTNGYRKLKVYMYIHRYLLLFLHYTMLN